MLVETRGGEMPASYEGLLNLKGVGDYTASAIASICFGEAAAVVDGNVSRVIARLLRGGGTSEQLSRNNGSLIQLATRTHERCRGNRSGTYNQAMMEFGALQCTPVSPDCEECPLSENCEARLSGRVELLPVKIPKRKPVERWMYFYVLVSEGETILTRRTEQGIWRSLYHFPMLERPEEHSGEEILGKLFQELMDELGITVEEAPDTGGFRSFPMCLNPCATSSPT